MFSHISVLLSFVYALAVTHLLTSATELLWARDRVRVSWLQVVWMFNALLILFENWISVFFLSALTRWDVTEITLWFTLALVQYFTCSLLSIRPKDEGAIDMPAFFERQRPLIFISFLAMAAIAMFQNWRDRATLPNPESWIYADLTIVPVVVTAMVAGFARATWLQWIAAIVTTVIAAYFLIVFALAG